MKFYALLDNDSKIFVVSSTSPPREYVSILDERERSEWLQLEKIDHGDGNGKVDTITINQSLKDQILADELSDKLQRDLDYELDKSNLKEAKIIAKLLNKNDLTDLESIRIAFENLNKFVLALEKRLLNIKEEQ